MTQITQERTDRYFLVFALSLAAGVPIALYAIYYFAQSIQFVATIFLVAILVVASVGILVVTFRDRISKFIFEKPIQTAAELAEPATKAIESYIGGKTEAGNEQVSKFAQSLLAYLAWIQTRRWIMAAATGLLLGFAGLVGSALLKQQNDLILDQNRFFQQQIEQQQQQLEAQQNVANQTVRSEAIRRIYGPEFANTPRVKAEAVRSLVVVERLRIDDGENTLPTDFINLHDVQLSQAWLDSADLRKISFRGGDLSRAILSSTQLEETVFRFADLRGAVLLSASAEGAQFMFTDARGALFSGAALKGANFNQSDLRGADLGGAEVAGTTFYKVNFEGANLSGLGDWERIASIDGSNIANLRGAPEGFVEWALSNGAIDEPGNTLELERAAADMRAMEETTAN